MSSITIIAGPTAVGKGTVVNRVLSEDPSLKLSVSCTTRDPRPGEVEGVNYYFVTREDFENRIAAGEFLEYALVHKQNYYGTPIAPLLANLDAGLSVILEIDIAGVLIIKNRIQEVPELRDANINYIFIAPPEPAFETLKARLVARGSESEAEQERRLETARDELALASEFEHYVINDNLDECVGEVLGIVTA
jgi:guanylate kinase